MAGIYSIGSSAGHRYAGWLETVEAKNFQFGGKVFNGSPSAIYVGSNLVWAGGWLEPAAVQAILGAFGQTDGMAVINATNAYLNQLAASDRDKATALAGWLNTYAVEDAKIVYSLVEGIGTRWLENSNGTAYADTGYIGDTSIRWELDYMFLFKSGKTSNIQNGAGSPNDTARFSCAYVTNGKFNIAIGKGFNSATQNSEYGVRKHFVLDAYNHYGMIDDERLETGNTFVSSGANICIFTRNENGNTSSYLHYGRCVKSKIYQNGTLVQYLIPFKRNGQMELLDLVSGNLATRVGTFTELIETHSTP